VVSKAPSAAVSKAASAKAASAKTATQAAKAPAAKAGKAVTPSAAKPVPVPKAAARPATKAAPVKPAAAPAKAPAPPAPKAKTPPAAKTAPKAATKAVAPAKAVKPVDQPAAVAAPAKTAKVAAKAVPVAAPAVVVEPTPRPLGKRAAKKVMMEQMTQAAVVPTHAPDAAKATFSTMNERVMTPPAPSAIQKDPKRANNWKTVPVDQLTDQDVQAMPDSEYMNDVQLAFFRRKLSLLKADMLANAGETTEHLREDTVVVPDPADRATIEEEHALELRTRDRERKLLKKIEQAIARIDSGDYGYCDETGEPIGVGRLMARPTASLSLEAQQRRELKQKMFGD
jgi:DnaK suppressor protein